MHRALITFKNFICNLILGYFELMEITSFKDKTLIEICSINYVKTKDFLTLSYNLPLFLRYALTEIRNVQLLLNV